MGGKRRRQDLVESFESVNNSRQQQGRNAVKVRVTVTVSRQGKGLFTG
jgi:hypothetical protein